MKKWINFEEMKDGDTVIIGGYAYRVAQYSTEVGEFGSFLAVPDTDDTKRLKGMNLQGVRITLMKENDIFCVERPEKEWSIGAMVLLVIVLGSIGWYGVINYPGTTFISFLCICLGSFAVSDTNFGKYFGLTD